MRKRLTPRRDAILRALVEEYIRTAEPVSSQILAEKYHLGYSSATIRIDLKELEEAELVFQRHTSSGRMPTDLGYRYFVECLMTESTLFPEEQRLIRHQFYQVQHQLDQWVRLTASIMSQALGGTAVVTLPRAAVGRLKHLEVLSLHDTVALLVVVLQDGSACQNRLYLSDPATQEEVSHIASHLNVTFSGHSADDVAEFIANETITTITSNERTIILGLEQLLRQHEAWSSDEVYQEGLTRMLSQPEFTRLGDERERGERIRKVVDALEQNRLLSLLGTQDPPDGSVQVVIGGESASEDLRDVSIVLGRYGLPGQSSGLIGIVGPTRMQYSRAIAFVRYMSEVMNDLLADLYGPLSDELLNTNES
jgi:heat-inducible transcriptional repressor